MVYSQIGYDVGRSRKGNLSNLCVRLIVASYRRCICDQYPRNLKCGRFADHLHRVRNILRQCLADWQLRRLDRAQGLHTLFD